LTDFSLTGILDRLNDYHQRASYGAVAGLTGKTPQNVMQGFRRGWRCSWVVNQQDGEPTGYHDLQKHPALLERAEILVTPDALASWLDSPT
jgi:hypothetical protein